MCVAIAEKKPSKILKNKKKNRGHCHYTEKYRHATHSVCTLRFIVSKEIPLVFHSRANYNYHFIIKELAKEFEGKFECLVENTEKCNFFSVLIEN